jgi:hypothetical protein
MDGSTGRSGNELPMAARGAGHLAPAARRRGCGLHRSTGSQWRTARDAYCPLGRLIQINAEARERLLFAEV